ncbi:MAG: hypothetical protein IT170_08200 [Bryobacterales bacterium]|nr:hypothetical protein [Bryobacterales bacterium]
MAESFDHIPQFARWISDFCANSTNPFVRDSAEALRIFFACDAAAPSSYKWVFSSDESFARQLQERKDIKAKNALYWEDFARNCEAYSVMTGWRAAELLRSSVRAINQKELVSSAVLARSLLELSSSYLLNANLIAKTLEGISFSEGSIVTSHDLEKLIVKAIWGSRLDSTPEHLKQRNCLTPIQKLTKNPDAKELLPTYEYLCELAHPNVLGNARFWSHMEEVSTLGAETRVITRFSESDAAAETIEKTVWSIAWSAAVVRNGIYILQPAIANLMARVRSC